MMLFFLVFCFSYFFMVVESSVHVLILLVMVEFMVLFGFWFFLVYSYSYFCCLLFLLIGVCVGAYSISLYVNLCRHKVSSYLMSFYYF